jgi:hypothetical protein
MTSLSRRLQRLEAMSGPLDALERRRELEEFGRIAQEYIRSVRQYLGEPPGQGMTILCRNQSDISQVVNNVVAYRIRSLRHWARQRTIDAECAEAGKMPLAGAPPGLRVE